MNPDDTATALIPFYANGTLGADERRQLEAHLESCADCQALLVEALALSHVYGRDPIGQLEDHPQAQVLAEFADHPDSLEADTERWVRSHLAGCGPCADTLEVYRAMVAEAVPPSPRPEAARPAPDLAWRIWDLLRGTVLRPAPALAYLLVLGVLAYPAARFLLEPRPGSGLAEVPPVISVRGDRLHRAGIGEAPILEIPADGADLVLLDLQTGVDEEDLRDPQATFRLEIRDGDEVVWSERRPGGAFDETGTLRLALHPGRLGRDRSFTIAIVFEKAGDPLDGRVLFGRSFRVLGEGATDGP